MQGFEKKKNTASENSAGMRLQTLQAIHDHGYESQ